MALLTNIDNKFSVSDAGAVRFNNAFTFPTADGTANYVLKTNGSGQLAWAPDLNSDAVTKIIGGTNITVSPATGLGDVTVNADLSGTVTGTGVNNRIAIWNGTTAIDSDSDFYVDGDTIFTTNLEASGNGSFSGTLTATNLSLGGTTAQYVRGDGSFATFSPGTGTVTGSGTANTMPVWTSASALGNSIITTGSPAGQATVGGVLNVTGNSNFQGSVDVLGVDDIRVRFLNSTTFKAGLQVPTTAGDMITDSAVDDFCIRSQTNTLFATGGATEKMRITSDGKVGIGTVLPGEYGPATGTVKLDVKSGDIIRSGFNNPANSWIGFTSLPGYAANSYPSVTSKSSIHFANNDKYCAFFEGTDTYFGMLNSASTTKVFFATGSQNSYLAGTGNFGVGITGPLAKLHVVGGTGMTGGWGRSIFLEDTYPAIVWGSNATKYAACTYDHSIDTMRWYTGAVTSDATQGANLRMSLKAGNLGIGTDSPLQKLQVQTGTDTDGIIITGDGTSMSTGEYRRLGFRYSSTDSSYSSEIRFEVPNSAIHGGAINFMTHIAGTPTFQSVMYLDENKRVGIGTTSNLSGPLTVQSDGGANSIHINGRNNGAADESVISFYDFDGTTRKGYILQTGGYMYFATGGSSTALTIDSSQNVGIGRTAPDYKLVVSNGNNEGIEFGPGYTSGANLFQNYNRTNSQYVRADWVASTHQWYQGDTASVEVRMSLTGSGVLTVKNDIVAYGSPSDIRLKENIKPIKSALDKVSKLQGVTFDWKKSDSILKIKEDIGFIAQDVQKVVPELVRENEDGMLSMRHQGIAPILLEAIKELKAEIEELKLNKCNCK